jgi:uncharacterized membrane protein
MMDQMLGSAASRMRADATQIRAGHSVRVSSIDVARGTAMFFVCLSHFSGVYLWRHGLKAADFLATVSMIASPSFVLISGMTLGFLGALNPRDVPYLRIRLLDRGVFLLLVGHLVLAASELGRNLSAAYSTSFLTDALAVAIIIGPRLVAGTGRAVRFALALALYCSAWLLLVRWHPGGSAALLARHYVLGTLPSEILGPRTIVFPVLPWLSVYLLGSIFGEHVGYFYRTREFNRARRLFLCVGAGSMFLGIGVYLITRQLSAVHSLVSRSMTAILLTSPTSKFPPGPVYVAYFGGSGLLCMWIVLEVEARRWLPWLTESLRRVGYSSLPVFLLQSFVYSIVRTANLPYSAWWPVLFFCTLVPMWLLAVVWQRAEANRFLTVGIAGWTKTKFAGRYHARLSFGSSVGPGIQGDRQADNYHPIATVMLAGSDE